MCRRERHERPREMKSFEPASDIERARDRVFNKRYAMGAQMVAGPSPNGRKDPSSIISRNLWPTVLHPRVLYDDDRLLLGAAAFPHHYKSSPIRHRSSYSSSPRPATSRSSTSIGISTARMTPRCPEVGDRETCYQSSHVSALTVPFGPLLNGRLQWNSVA
jgi:hypothetical protein